MKKILLFSLILANVPLFAQFKDLVIKLSPNYTFVGEAKKDQTLNAVPITLATGYTSTTYNVGGIAESYRSKSGLNLAMDFQAAEFGKFFLRTGVGVQYLRFQRSIKFEDLIKNFYFFPVGQEILTGSGYSYGIITGGYVGDVDGNLILDQFGQPIIAIPALLGTSPNLGKTSTLYLQIPITIGRRFLSDRLILSTGISTNYLIRSTEIKENYAMGAGTSKYKNINADGYSNFLVGGLFESSYLITKQIGISLAYTRTFTPIYKENNRFGGKAFYNVLSLGANYHFKK